MHFHVLTRAYLCYVHVLRHLRWEGAGVWLFPVWQKVWLYAENAWFFTIALGVF